MADDFNFKVEVQLWPEDWDTKYTAAQKEARTFSTTVGDSDSRLKVVEVRLVRSYLGKIKDLMVMNPGTEGNMWFFPNPGLDTENFGSTMIIPFVGNREDKTDINKDMQEYLVSKADEEYFVEILLHYVKSDANLVFFKPNELFRLIDTNTNIDKIFKVLDINYDFTDTWSVRIKGTDNPGLIKDALPPDIIERYGDELLEPHSIDDTNSQGHKILNDNNKGNLMSVNQLQNMPGYTPSHEKILHEQHWEELDQADEKYIGTAVAKDYGYTWALGSGDAYIAIGDDDSNPGTLTMQNELARVQATYQTFAKGSGGVWLGDWQKRVKITLDKDQIDAAMTNKPVTIFINSSCGQSNQDLTAVFDEITTNSLKIAVTDYTMLAEQSVEVDKWDNGNELGVYHIKVAALSVIADGVLYLYYDNDHADNTDYVGAPNSTAAAAVWDSNYKLVDHMNDGASTSTTRDSTDNDHDGTKTGANEPIVNTSGTVGNMQDFDGTDDIVGYGDHADFTFGNGTIDSPLSIECQITPDDATNATIVAKYDDAGAGAREYRLYLDANDKLNFEVWDESGASSRGIRYETPIVDDAVHHVVVTYDGDETDPSPGMKMYIDGVNVSVSATVTGGAYTAMEDTARALELGRDSNTNFFDGDIDEVRLSSVVRTAAEIELAYQSQADNIATFGAEETIDAVKLTSAEFTKEDFGANTSFPYMVAEVGLFTVASGGSPKSRVVFWVPTTGENIDDDQPADTQYHPDKPFFSNTRMLVQHNSDL